MRRPLCAVCLAFAAAVAILQADPLPPPDYREAEGAAVTVTGRVADRETRTSAYYGEQTILYLKDISTISYEDDFQTEKNFQIEDDFQAKNDFQTKTEQAEGVICYLAAGQVSAMIGSRVTVSGTLRCFERAKVPGGYDEAAYYQTEGYSFVLQKAELLQESSIYSRLDEALLTFRSSLGTSLQAVLDEQDAAVLRAMLLGERKALPSELKKLYQKASISHILVISGLHITFLGMGLHKLLRRTPLPGAVVTAGCILCMYLYGRMTGMGISALRAIFMFALMLAASVLGRSYDLLTALALSAALILLRQPLYIRHSGFLLSFGAVLGLALIAPALQGGEKKADRLAGQRSQEKAQGKLRAKQWSRLESGLREGMEKTLREGLTGGIAVFLATLPISVQFFYEVCPYSILFNLLVIPLSALLLPAGLLIPVLYALWPPLAVPAGGLCHLILLVYEQGSRLAVSLPGSRLRIGHAEPVQIVLYYLFLSVSVLWGYRASRPGLSSKSFYSSPSYSSPFYSSSFYSSFFRKMPKPKNLDRLLQLMLLTAAVRLITLQIPYNGLQITMLDVGQGDCFLIQTGNTKFLVDGGSSSVAEAGTYRILPALKYYGIRELDYIFISHLDEDHINGIRQLLQDGEIRCRVLCLPDASIRAGSSGWEEEQEKEQALLEAAGLWPDGAAYFQRRVQEVPRLFYLGAGDQIIGQDFRIDVLYPQGGTEVSDENSASLVLLLQSEDTAILFPGDLPGEQEIFFTEHLQEIGQSGAWSGLILKAGHHGSNGSTTEALLRAAEPVLTLISCGENNSYGHPGREMVQRVRESGSYLLNTAQDGTCELFIKSGEIRIQTMQ